MIVTQNSLKAKELELAKEKLQEERRSNMAKENLETSKQAYTKQDLKNQEFHRGMKDFFTGMEGAVKALKPTANDYSWYVSYGQSITNLLLQPIHAEAGVGDIRATNRVLGTTSLAGEVHMNKPALVYYKFVPSLGNCNGQESPTSMAVRQFNTDIRGKNSGATNYDAVDLFQFPLAIDSILYCLAWLRRGFSLVNFCDYRQPITTGYALLLAHCFNDSNILSYFLDHRNQLVDYYNMTVDKIAALHVPLNLSYIKRHAWLSDTIFFNHNHVGTVFHIVNPEIYYVYDEANGKLEAKDIYLRIRSGGPESIRLMLSEMINAILGSQTMATMSGDIEAAKVPVIQIDTINIDSIKDMKPNLVNDIKYLQSFKNADIFNYADLSDLSIQQGIDRNGNPFIYQGTWNGSSWTGPAITLTEVYAYDKDENYDTQEIETHWDGNDVLIDYYDPMGITEEDQCYNFSFKFILNQATFSIEHARSELLTCCNIYRYDKNSSALIPEVTQNSNILENSVDDQSQSWGTFRNNMHQDVHAANLLAMLDFVPRFYFFCPVQESGGNYENYVEIYWSRNVNRNFVTPETSAQILDYTLRSMFNIKTSSSNSRKSKPRKR